MQTINVTDLIDRSRISAFQIRVFALCGLVILLDGIDYQLIGIAAPKIVQEFGFPRGALGWVFAAAPLGAAIGGLSCGPVADRLGRQKMLVVTTFLFGAATLATTLTDGIMSLVLVRFITGVGLGGAVPCCIAMTSEYAPARRRAAIVSLLWAAFPLGGMTGGFANAYLIQHVTWRTLFEVWGLLPIGVALLLLLALPESARFLLIRQADRARLNRIVGQISGIPADAATFTSTEEPLPGLPVRHLFSGGRATGTIPLWLSMFIVLGTLTILAAWTPALITPLGFTSSDAALVVAAHGLGSFVGTACAGRIMERLGVTRSVIPVFILAAASVMAYGAAGSHGFALLVFTSVLTGVFLGLASSSVIALAALVYPTAVRSTGVGWAVSMGRFGSVAGPVAVGVMVGRGADVTDVFLTLGAALLVAVPCIWALGAYSRHQRLLEPASEYDAALDTGRLDVSKERPA